MKTIKKLKLINILLVLLILVNFLTFTKTTVSANTAADISKSIVRVLSDSKVKGYYVSGTGFAIGNKSPVKYIVTNSHVCNGNKTVSILLTRDQIVKGKVIIDLPQTDLAVIELNNSIAREPVTISDSTGVEVGQKVSAVGFPGAADINGLTGDLSELSVTEGSISKIGQIQWLQGVKCYQTTAPVNPGNSGGPLIDEKGNVIGIVTYKSNEGDNIAIAVQTEELMTALDNLAIPYNKLDKSKPAAETSNEAAAKAETKKSDNTLIYVIAVLAALVILAAIVIAVMLIKKKPKKTEAPKLTRAISNTPVLSKGKLLGVSGTFAAQAIEFDNNAIILGRDPSVSQLVFPSDAEEIGRKHCVIKFDAVNKTFILEDCASTNGTFLYNGKKLEPYKQEVLKNGDRFYLANQKNVFEVRID
ncbi:MAG: trypsin-like peptidase domain-containing protein [Bacillota bacterium]|nr:trypsin-like peptidase domain-containing protein [Bacillota bacterium]